MPNSRAAKNMIYGKSGYHTGKGGKAKVKKSKKSK